MAIDSDDIALFYNIDSDAVIKSTHGNKEQEMVFGHFGICIVDLLLDSINSSQSRTLENL